ncbi:N-6 DNA methylase [Lutibacter sp. HS1-25]|uniref:HsdM family class I SAM-dependent methyltransferase n=1 Tax=Lutibacter sp. HS1-25 TaxID=2485000 RepID=UPI0010139A63|nr:N-6 DNA methylase [Lutibacter sp. HS1-25]RXP54553.1 N-6 DNA methylase [Lutibacter sp. HS1-25]
MSQNILQYESKVWSTADLLIGAGIKQSDFPKYMMPYFAMMMLESRLLRRCDELLKDFSVTNLKEIDKTQLEDFISEFKDDNIGYNDLVVRHNKTLAEICLNDKTFDNDFDAYLKAFDSETKELLGVDRGNTEEKYLDISGVSGQLRKKDILFDSVKKWSEIDLAPFNNSEITTLEEHIKRKWADISAETAGEQYTPDDIIALISEIILSKIDNNGEFLTIYDPTCGGGNLLFGVEDKIQEKYNRPTKTYGEDWSDSLYALAKIESRFRKDSDIRYGNTLTNISFIERKFDIVVANPPYGVDWKGYKKDIENDTTERFKALPSISDGQFLFTQHIISQLDENKGLAVVVHNGSTLFSGDAGSGESNIRKYFFDEDIVEAIIQMPTDEFFNTGIYTYLWVFNKNKAAERKDKVILINGSDFFEPLKKSKGKKRKEMVLNNRKTIIDALTNFEDSEYAKVFDKWHFYFNKQAIMLTNVDENGKTLESVLPVKKNKDGEETRAKSIKLNPTKITQVLEDCHTEPVEVVELTDFEITTFDATKYNSLFQYYTEYLSPLVNSLDYKETDLKVTTVKETYYFDADKETIIKQTKDSKTGTLCAVEMGCGKIVIKSSFKKPTKTKEAFILITVELTPDYEKDYEIIPYSPNEEDNQQNIANFMAKYITKPFSYIDNTIGVEINFNKVFYKPEDLKSLSKITSDLKDLEDELKLLEDEL